MLNEQQLAILKKCYQVNARPDALVKEQLVEMTGLNARVIRVWFQNKRCKDKKRQIQMRDHAANLEKVRLLLPSPSSCSKETAKRKSAAFPADFASSIVQNNKRLSRADKHAPP